MVNTVNIIEISQKIDPHITICEEAGPCKDNW